MKLRSVKNIKVIVISGLIIVPFLILILLSSFIQARYHETMDAAHLFETTGSGGKGFAILVESSLHEDELKYKRGYLSDDQLPLDPKNVGYVIRITYKNVHTVNYTIKGTNDTFHIPGYRVDTLIQLYDRSAGRIIGQITL